MSLEECQQLATEDQVRTVEKLGAAIADLNAVIREVRTYMTGEPMGKVPPSTQP